MDTTTGDLPDRIFESIVEEICSGALAPGTHLLQEDLADRFRVSRQPIQQVMMRLKAEGMVEEQERRRLFVVPLDPLQMHEHYGVREALDAWSAKAAARRLSVDPALRDTFAGEAELILKAHAAAIAKANAAAQIRQDDALHALIYEASGNSMMARTAKPHWRFLRRAMTDVLPEPRLSQALLRQHEAIVAAIAAGDAARAEQIAVAHVAYSAKQVVRMLQASRTGKSQERAEKKPC